ncbi:hypothetical protein GQ41_1161 [Arenibacter algicola]|uniref:Uncharacterized protein n=1 Tax=Arenibacter algicola TaxID=616991 RepID=A0ABY3A9E4_9FLAO
MKTKNCTESTSNNKSIHKPIIKQRLITLIKAKYEEVDGIEYDCMVKDFHLLKSSSGLFSIVIPTK